MPYSQAVHFITDNQTLATVCRQFHEAPAIALDTEFIRVRTFYPKAGLFQLNSQEAIYLIDPLVIDRWQPFVEVLQNPEVVKVLHACDEDVELMQHCFGVKPCNVFDTQVAAAFCGFDYSMGYQRLLESLLGISIEKGSSRSDWLKRPLSDVQCQYAADDVRYLLGIYQRLQTQLQANGFAYAVQEECDQIVANVANDDFSQAYKRIKKIERLSPLQQAWVKRLSVWREQAMRRLDLPRNQVFNNQAIVHMAMRPPQNMQGLFNIEGVPAVTAKKQGEQLLAEMNSWRVQLQQQPPAREPQINKHLLQRLKKGLNQQAVQAGISELMLSKKSYNEALAAQPLVQFDAIVTDWRKPYYQAVLSAFEE